MNNILKKEFNFVRLIILILPMALFLIIPSSFYRDMLILVMIWSAAATAWNLLGGFAGQLSIGHAAFFGIGAYSSTLLFVNFGISPWIGMIIGGLLSAVVAVFIGFLTFPLKGPFFSLATIAFLEIVRIISISWSDVTAGAAGVIIPFAPSFGNLVFENQFMTSFMIWILMILMYLVAAYFNNSRLGYYLMAYRENEDAAKALGINTVNIRLKAIAISAFLTAVIGTFFAQYILFIDPESIFKVENSLQMVLLSLVGGVGTTIGPIVGGYIMVPLGQLLRAFLGGIAPGLHLVVYGICLILILFYLPKGLVPLFSKKFNSRKRTVSKEVKLNKLAVERGDNQ